MTQRQSKSPLRAIFTIFQKKEEDDYTPICLGDEKKKFYWDPIKKKYVFEGEPVVEEQVIAPPPAKAQIKSTASKQEESSITAPPQNASLNRARQMKKSSENKAQLQKETKTSNSPAKIKKLPNNIANDQQKQEKQDHQNINQVQQQQRNPQQNEYLQQEQSQEQSVQIQKISQQQQIINPQQQQQQQQQIDIIFKNNQAQYQQIQSLKSQLQIQQSKYNELQQLHCKNKQFIEYISQKSYNLIDKKDFNYDLIQLQEICLFEIQKEPIIEQTVWPQFQQITPLEQSNVVISNQYLKEIIESQNEELNDLSCVIQDQVNEIQIKDLQLQQQQSLLSDLIKKLDDYVGYSNQLRKQNEQLNEERKQYLRIEDNLGKQYEIQIRNLQKEKDAQKRSILNLQKDRDQYAQHYEELRKQYDEDMSVMNSQIEQSQIMINEQEFHEVKQQRDQLLIDLDIQSSEIEEFRQLIKDIAIEINQGLKFICDSQIKSIGSKLDLQTIFHNYKREFQKQLIQKDQNYQHTILELKSQLFHLNLQKSSQDQVVSQQEKQIQQIMNDILQSKKEISIICREYEEQIKNINDSKLITVKELKQCEEQLFQMNLSLVNSQMELKSIHQKHQIEIQSYQLSNETLNNQSKKYSSQLMNLQEQLNTLELEVQKYKKQQHTYSEIQYSLEQQIKQNEQVKLSWEKEIIDLKNDIKIKDQDLSNKQLELNTYKTDQSNLIDQFSLLEKQFEEQINVYSIENNQLASQNQNYMNLRDEMNLKISDLQNQNRKINDQLREQQDNFDQEIFNYNQQNSQKEKDLILQINELKSIYNTDTQKFQQQQILIEDLKKQNQLLTDQNEELKQQQQQQQQDQEQFDLLLQQNKQLEEQLLTVKNNQQKDMEEQIGIIQNLRSDYQQLQEKQEELINSKDQVEQQLVKALEDLQQQRTTIDQYEQGMQSQNIDNSNSEQTKQLEQQIEQFEQQMEPLLQQLQELDDENQRLKQDIEEYKSQLEQSLNRIAQLRSQEYDGNYELSQLRQKYNEYQIQSEQLKRLKEEHDKTVEVLELANQQLEAKSADLDSLRIELSKVRAEYKKVSEEQEKTIQQLRGNEKQDQSEKFTQLQTEYNYYKETTKQSIDETSKRIVLLESEIISLNAKILQVCAQRDEYKEQLEYKQKTPQQVQQIPKGVIGALAGFFATESELKKLKGSQ